ncbi:MAG TPA: peptide deformylase [Tepidisphaeraceae bacterium]|nr:peptide deformylase [Tepidisphaeraceae bacterium]
MKPPELPEAPVNLSGITIVRYPHPALRRISAAVARFDPSLRDLAARMIELMRGDKGVGLAAPQVGINLRMFVINPTGKPGDDQVYVNPVLSAPAGEETAEEGCLSLPEIRVDVVRSKRLQIDAQDLNGERFREEADGYVARIWQHENDHLDGILLLDKMGPLDKLAARKKLKQLEEAYAAAHPAPPAAKRRRSRR